MENFPFRLTPSTTSSVAYLGTNLHVLDVTNMVCFW